jgi:hypothetical protein
MKDEPEPSSGSLAASSKALRENNLPEKSSFAERKATLSRSA